VKEAEKILPTYGEEEKIPKPWNGGTVQGIVKILVRN